MQCLGISLDPEKFPQKKYQLTAEFSRDKNYLYVFHTYCPMTHTNIISDLTLIPRIFSIHPSEQL